MKTLPDSVSNNCRKDINNLKRGKEFCKSYLSMIPDDHKNDIPEFRKCAYNYYDSTIKFFSASTLPVSEKHLDSFQVIAKKTLESFKPEAENFFVYGLS
jgi:Domain of unknown function (DUF4142)